MAEHPEHADAPERIEWLELFFDLVVVAAVAVLTEGLRADATWGGLGIFLVTYGAVWFAWVSVVMYTDVAAELTRVRFHERREKYQRAESGRREDRGEKREFLELHEVGVDREHLDERLGLFVIIVLGESVAALVMNAARSEWDREFVSTTLASFVLRVLLWLLTFSYGFASAPAYVSATWSRGSGYRSTWRARWGSCSSASGSAKRQQPGITCTGCCCGCAAEGSPCTPLRRLSAGCSAAPVGSGCCRARCRRSSSRSSSPASGRASTTGLRTRC